MGRMFRKKPVVIEAVQLRWDTWSEMCEFADVGTLKDGKPTGCYIGQEDGHPLPDGQTSEEMGLLIPTPDGIMVGRQNDWIIRGIRGELYPCKPDVFEATYEIVDTDFYTHQPVFSPEPTQTSRSASR